jgi:hypothetical protein
LPYETPQAAAAAAAAAAAPNGQYARRGSANSGRRGSTSPSDLSLASLVARLDSIESKMETILPTLQSFGSKLDVLTLTLEAMSSANSVNWEQKRIESTSMLAGESMSNMLEERQDRQKMTGAYTVEEHQDDHKMPVANTIEERQDYQDYQEMPEANMPEDRQDYLKMPTTQVEKASSDPGVSSYDPEFANSGSSSPKDDSPGSLYSERRDSTPMFAAPQLLQLPQNMGPRSRQSSIVTFVDDALKNDDPKCKYTKILPSLLMVL